MNEEDEEGDLYLEELLTDATAPYVGRIPPEEIRAMRAELRAAVADDPELQRLYQAARPRSAPARTGEAARDEVEDAATVAAPAPRGRRGAA